jgi:hypothetical protein
VLEIPTKLRKALGLEPAAPTDAPGSEDDAPSDDEPVPDATPAADASADAAVEDVETTPGDDA